MQYATCNIHLQYAGHVAFADLLWQDGLQAGLAEPGIPKKD